MSVCLCSRTGCIQAHCINARVFYAFSLNVLNEQHLSWRPSRSTKGRFFLLFFLSTIDLNIVSVLSMRHELFRILSLFYTYSLSLSLSLSHAFTVFPTWHSSISFAFQTFQAITQNCSAHNFIPFPFPPVLPFVLSLFLFVRTNTVPLFVSYASIFIYMYIYIYKNTKNNLQNDIISILHASLIFISHLSIFWFSLPTFVRSRP